MPKQTGFIAWYDRLISSFSIEDLFVRKRPPGPPRSIYINEPLPEEYYDKKHHVLPEHQYASNQVITSKYTLITFLPRNLLEQYRRVANVFFTFIAILQFIPKFSTISPGLVILPLVIVLGVTAIKDAYEDIKRHQSDRVVNFSQIHTLDGGGYVNHNAMAPKSRTFVRALTKRIGKEKLTKSNQALTNPAPPETLEKSTSPANSDSVDAEYDDDRATDPKPHWKSTTWEDLRVGDFVKIFDHESIPADVLICATSEDDNVAFVETKNLDGETNLKSCNAVPALTHLRNAPACADAKNTFRIECDRPEVLMHKLAAAVTIGGEAYPVDLQATLLRGTVLRNTGWVIGIVMYTGLDTKLVLNSGGTPSKRGKVERQMNPMVLANLVLLVVMAAVCGIIDSVLEHHYYPRQAPWLFRDNRSGDNPSVNGLVTLLFAFITFQNIVPISLYISIEAVRACQAAFIYFDVDMYYKKTDSPALARTFTLSDDLGQIEYVFSDKTGTLTQNLMLFRRASVGGQTYVDEEPEETVVDVADVAKSPSSTPSGDVITSGSEVVTGQSANIVNSREQLPEVVRHFRSAQLDREIEAAAADIRSPDRDRHGQYWTTLALCHTVLAAVNPRTGLLEYKSQSPDEAALVQAAADVGFEFRGRDRDVLLLRTPFAPEPLRFRLLNILEFTSTRKRMSIIVRQLGEDDEPGNHPIFLLCKGADNVIFERLALGGEELKTVTGDQLDMFAREGLRTLTLAYRVIPENEYDSWVEQYRNAIVSVDNRESEVERVSDEAEQNLLLLGATAIEDKLQDGVPEAIADLKRSGIKIWVLTGDKLETAIAIGKSTNLIGREANIIIIRGGGEGASIYTQMLRATEEYFPNSNITEDPGVNAEALGTRDEESARGSQLYPLRRVTTGATSLVGSMNGQRPGGYVLVIDGLALTEALKDDLHMHLLLRLATLCEGVVCCRVSPKQKALVVKLVKNGLDTMTLAIGDGANDVSMIQAADVGVGISGEEGLQAVNSSDYAIAQFRFLKRLLLVHGHWSYARNGNMINNFFYKNIICIGVLWWFMFYCGWSSAYVFEYTYLLWWNSFWTLCPVIAIGLFDRIVDDHVLMALPELYRYGREGKWFGVKLFSVFMFEGVFQSIVVYFILLYAYFSRSARNDGFDVAGYEFSTTMVISAAIAANLFNGLNTRFWTAWVFFAVFIGIVLIFGYTAIYSIISPGWISTPIYGNDHFLFKSPIFWFGIPITVILALLPRYLYMAWSFGFRPNDLDILNWNYKLKPDMDLIHEAYLNNSQAEAEARILDTTTPRSESPGPFGRPSMQGSHIDMSTGMRSQSRGYSFAQEENGVAMRRMQSNLSGAVPPPARRIRGSALLRSIRHPLRRKPHSGEPLKEKE